MKDVGTKILETERLTLRKFTLDECGLHVVEAKHYSSNPASGRVMQKAGMMQEAVMIERHYEEDTDSYSDLICYYIKR